MTREEELRAALKGALALIDEYREYLREAWDWKYAKRWDEETAALQAALDTPSKAEHELEYLRKGLRMIADAAKDKTSSVWIESRAEALLRGEEFVNIPTTQ